MVNLFTDVALIKSVMKDARRAVPTTEKVATALA